MPHGNHNPSRRLLSSRMIRPTSEIVLHPTFLICSSLPQLSTLNQIAPYSSPFSLTCTVASVRDLCKHVELYSMDGKTCLTRGGRSWFDTLVALSIGEWIGLHGEFGEEET
jgi:hypothetical protein